LISNVFPRILKGRNLKNCLQFLQSQLISSCKNSGKSGSEPWLVIIHRLLSRIPRRVIKEGKSREHSYNIISEQKSYRSVAMALLWRWMLRDQSCWAECRIARDKVKSPGFITAACSVWVFETCLDTGYVRFGNKVGMWKVSY
jgi:hypothetical protein